MKHWPIHHSQPLADAGLLGFGLFKQVFWIEDISLNEFSSIWDLHMWINKMMKLRYQLLLQGSYGTSGPGQEKPLIMSPFFLSRELLARINKFLTCSSGQVWSSEILG